ncbi:MAG TPA: hypothetical protein VHW69_13280 [Rhizomicrobium sp.]|nr:hypothetical protein [Rhizomicrobium sp.]
MKRVFIHCGLPKCGSTSLQAFLTGNSPFLAENGFEYPTAGMDANRLAQHNLVYEMLGSPQFKPELGTTNDVIASFRATVLDGVLSSEGFSRILWNQMYYQNFETFHDGLRCAGAEEISYVLFIRNVVSFVESSYIQSIIAGNLKEPSLVQFARSRAAHFQELFDGLEWLGETLDSSVILRDVTGHDSSDVFLKCIGITSPAPPKPERKNVRVSLKRAAFLYRYRFIENHSHEQFRKLARRLSRLPAGPGESKQSYRLLPRGLADEISETVGAISPLQFRYEISLATQPETVDYEPAILEDVPLSKEEVAYFLSAISPARAAAPLP